jgi:enoyl-[acyl-carrier protein] reductase I
MLLEGRKLLITGVLTDKSIAFTVARRAQEEGAEVILTGFGRGMRITERMAKRLPPRPRSSSSTSTTPTRSRPWPAMLDERWGSLDGCCTPSPSSRRRDGRAVPADPERLGRSPRSRRARSRSRRSPPRCCPCSSAASRRAVVGLDFDASAWPGRPTTGPASPRPPWSRSTATSRATSARRGVRSNLVAAGPLQTVAGIEHRGLDGLGAGLERQAPLGWDLSDPTPVADACLFLLSRWRERSRRDRTSDWAACTRWGRRPAGDARRPCRPPTPSSSSRAQTAHRGEAVRRRRPPRAFPLTWSSVAQAARLAWDACDFEAALG